MACVTQAVLRRSAPGLIEGDARPLLPAFSVAGLRLNQLDLSADLKPMGFSHDSFEGSSSCGSLIFFGDVSNESVLHRSKVTSVNPDKGLLMSIVVVSR